MNSRNRNSRRARRPTTNRGTNKRVLRDLDQLTVYADADRSRMIPTIPDPPRIFRQNKVVTEWIPMSYQAPNITGSSTVENIGAINFSLSSVPGYTSWTACWDQYRIMFAEVNFVPFSIGLTGTSQTNGLLYTAIDYDDSTPVTATSLLQYSTLMCTSGISFFSRRLTPVPAVAAYGGSVFTAYASPKGGRDGIWIDSDSPSVPYYGLKYSQSVTSSAVTTSTPTITVWVQFRGSF